MSSESPSPPPPAIDPPDTPTTLPYGETAEQVRKRSQAIAWAAGAFLALGLGLPIGFALRDWKIGLAVAVIVGALTVVGYLKAGADHAERRAARVAREHSLTDEEMDEEEEDNGAYR
ncbi:MAG: hypothetical protein QM589_11465 [Thermomicrobiales bacterium]